MALSVISYFFFVDASEPVRIGMFVLMFVGFALLSISLLKSSSPIHMKAEEKESLPAVEPDISEIESTSGTIFSEVQSEELDRDRIKLSLALNRLTRLWWPMSTVIFTVLVLQSIFGKYGSAVEQAWAWLLPTLFPTLSVLVVSQVVNVRNVTVNSVKVSSYRLTWALSLFYLLMAFAVIFLQPFVSLPALTFLSASNLYLAPLQGLVLAALYFLIVSRGHERFREAFGVLWDNNYNMRCLSCKKPLKNSTL